MLSHYVVILCYTEGLKGMALFGGAVLAVGGAVGLALALAKGKK